MDPLDSGDPSRANAKVVIIKPYTSTSQQKQAPGMWPKVGIGWPLFFEV